MHSLLIKLMKVVKKIDEVAEAVAKPEAEDLTLVPSSANMKASMLMIKEHKPVMDHMDAPVGPMSAVDPGPLFAIGGDKEDHFVPWIKDIPVGAGCCHQAQLACVALPCFMNINR